MTCGVVAFGAIATQRAEACENGTGGRLRGPGGSLFAGEEELIAQLKKAENALRLSNYSLAAAEIDAVRLSGEPTPRMRSRLERVSALLTVRTQGQWPAKHAQRANNDSERVNALKTAVKALRKRLAEAPKDPVRQSDLGEALAAMAEHRAEARRLLEKLASADLLATPHAYDALARVRASSGDAAGAEAARSRCKQLDSSEHACHAPEA